MLYRIDVVATIGKNSILTYDIIDDISIDTSFAGRAYNILCMTYDIVHDTHIHNVCQFEIQYCNYQ
jgi:hypothetical protein